MGKNTEDQKNLLRLGRGNSKLDSKIRILSLPAGHSCPGASQCLTLSDPDTGKITDGCRQKFRCYAASSEAAFPSVRKKRWYNFSLLTEAEVQHGKEGIVALLSDSIPEDTEIFRIHDSGDFFSQIYFDAWMEFISTRSNTLFYAYTKSIPFVTYSSVPVPSNVSITASMGGMYDHMVEASKLFTTQVVSHPEEAESMGLEIDHDDSHAIAGNNHFALLLHGAQPKGSDASLAIRRMKKEEVAYGYGRKGS